MGGPIAAKQPPWMFRVNTLVLFKGQWFKVTAVRPSPHARYTYDLVHAEHGEKHTHTDLPQWMLVYELPAMAKHVVGAAVNWKGKRWTVTRRKWSREMQRIHYSVDREGVGELHNVAEHELGVWEGG